MGRYETPLAQDWWKAALAGDDQSASVIGNATTWDRDDYAQLLREMRKPTAAQKRLAKFAPTGAELTSDAFLALFKAAPELAGAAAVRPDHLINRTVIDELQGMTEYKELHGYIAAATASVAVYPRSSLYLVMPCNSVDDSPVDEVVGADSGGAASPAPP